MTDIQKGLPNLTITNENFKRGRKTAYDILDAGPGHHTMVEFNVEDKEDLKSFINGCRYIAKSHDTLKVVRRTDKDVGMAKVYVINQD